MLFLPVFHWLELAEAPGWPLGGHVGGGTCTSTRPAGRLDPSFLLRVVVTSVPHTRPNTVLTLWNSVPGGRVLSGVSRLLSLSQVQQSSFYGYTGMLPKRYTQGVMTGESEYLQMPGWGCWAAWVPEASSWGIPTTKLRACLAGAGDLCDVRGMCL